ncbi:MAG: hypothetical protein ACEY3K_10870, partial [Wolbachia sp.]
LCVNLLPLFPLPQLNNSAMLLIWFINNKNWYKELKNYKANDKNLFDVIIEYFQKFCEKFGFHFFEENFEYNLDKPLRALSDINTSQDKNLNLKNLK